MCVSSCVDVIMWVRGVLTLSLYNPTPFDVASSNCRHRRPEYHRVCMCVHVCVCVRAYVRVRECACCIRVCVGVVSVGVGGGGAVSR